MHFLAEAIPSNASSNGLELIYYLSAIVVAVIAIAVSIRSIIVKMIERSKEEALEKQANNEAMHANTRAIEKLDSTTGKLTDKLEQFTFDSNVRMNDMHSRLERLERLTPNK